jgi:metal-sulfur cluster biosynthetic enzyme
MSKFINVKAVPTNLRKGEVVVQSPDFLEQIRACTHKASKKNLTGLNHLRDILNAIRQKYDPELNIFKVPFSQYEGLSFQDEAHLSQIVVRLVKKECPAVFEKVLEYNIKNRPTGSKLIYYVGDWADTGAFTRNGIDAIEEKDVDEYLGLKAKKIVGKPAVTKEESEGSAS